jgi:DNA-binding CsgD family transcriptional regulator
MRDNAVEERGYGCPCGHSPVRIGRSAEVPRPRLTSRQRQIVVAWLRSDTKGQVAQELFITPSTVKTHI